ncbi:MAG: prepilin peptidase [Bacteroidia bacterium]|nr:prepilin peptidase [Bacteroidia bacterium]
MNIIFLILLGLCSVGIAYQDFKERMISLWLIVLFSLLSLLKFLRDYDLSSLYENTIFLLLYMLLSFVILKLYYFLKEKRFTKILDEKIGAGDVLLISTIGLCLEPTIQIVFFTFSFLVTLIIIPFLKTKTAPLGAVLVICFLAYHFAVMLGY